MKTKAIVKKNPVYGFEICPPKGFNNRQLRYKGDVGQEYYLSHFLDITLIKAKEYTSLTLREIYDGVDASVFACDFESDYEFGKYERYLNQKINELRNRIIEVEANGYHQSDYEVFYAELEFGLEQSEIDKIISYFKNAYKVVEWELDIELWTDYNNIGVGFLILGQEFLDYDDIVKALEEEKINYDVLEIIYG